jgi:hypothetical protein
VDSSGTPTAFHHPAQGWPHRGLPWVAFPNKFNQL